MRRKGNLASCTLRLAAAAALLVGCTRAVGTAAGEMRSDAPASSAGAPGPASSTLQVRQRYLVDTCGEVLIVRGVEEPLGLGMEAPAWDPERNPKGGTLERTIDEMAATGANAVRLLANLSQIDLERLDGLFTRITGHKMVVFWSLSQLPKGMTDEQWWARPEVKGLVARHAKWLVLDALQESDFDDRARWKREAIARVRFFRAQGYTQPLNLISNRFGRDLGAILVLGKEVAEADPLHRVILGWQAYWYEGGHGWNRGWTYQGEYKMTLAEGIAAAARLPFPVQIGIEYFTENDPKGPYMDYADAMTAAGLHRVGWLWWDYYNPFGADRNNLSRNGLSDPANLVSPYGDRVVNSHAFALRTAVRACGR